MTYYIGIRYYPAGIIKLGILLDSTVGIQEPMDPGFFSQNHESSFILAVLFCICCSIGDREAFVRTYVIVLNQHQSAWYKELKRIRKALKHSYVNDDDDG